MITSSSKKCIAVIPSIEGWHLLIRLLPTIDLPKEQILVVDQGSRDGTEKKCREQGYGCIQMHTQASFAAAANRGIQEALARQADYVLLINNDVEFLTHVATQLVQRAEKEVNLGVIAPRQIIEKNNKKLMDIKRARWELTELDFSWEFDTQKERNEEVSPHHLELLEADFCEFTCVLIKCSIFPSVGFLDERYQFYHEDADFCYRSQLAGYRCAYDQTAVIKHYVSSTFEKQKVYDKKKLITSNKSFFASDHLKNHVRYPSISSPIASSWSTTNDFLYSYLNKYGLMGSSVSDPSLSSLCHPGMVDTDYLYTVWETSRIPVAWLTESKRYKHIFVPSAWNKKVFENSGFKNVSLLPLGVETDLFHPWGPKLSFPWEKSLLCVFQNQYRKALDVTLKMWGRIRSQNPGVFLVLYGKDIDISNLGITVGFTTRIGNFIARIDPQRQIALLQPAFGEYARHEEMAALYRSCTFYLLNSRSEGFGYPVLEAMACGCVCIVANYGATKEFIQEGNCIPFEGAEIKADYSDKGFYDVGNWWEPHLDDLCLKVETALQLDERERAEIGHRARQGAVSNYTWRHSMMALRKNLQQIQASSSHQVVHRKRKLFQPRKQAAVLMNSIGEHCIKVGMVIEQQGFHTAALRIASKIKKKLGRVLSS